MNKNLLKQKEIVIKGMDLCRYYKRGSETVKALDNVNIDIYSAESVCILGPSGSGKTTLINILSALDAPTAGQLFINNKPVHGLKESELVDIRRGTIGYVFQQFHLIPTLTVKENIMLPLLFLNRKPDSDQIDKVLEGIGLLDRANHFPSELSGGQMQRVAIGRALITHPRVLIADEPTGNLDRQTGLAIMDLFLATVKKESITLILTTHNLEFSSFCDRVIRLRDGKIAE